MRMGNRIKQCARDLVARQASNFLWRQEEVKRFGLAYQIGAICLLIATVLPLRLAGFITLIVSAIITVYPLLQTELWRRIPSIRWSTYISYSLLLAAQLVDELWPRVVAMLVTTMISNWTQNVLFRQQEELIRQVTERQTVAKIIEKTAGVRIQQ